MTDSVNGIVIGSVTYKAELLQPSGNVYGLPMHFETYSEAVIWAQDTVDSARKEVGPEECRRLGYDQRWELRFYDK